MLAKYRAAALWGALFAFAAMGTAHAQQNIVGVGVAYFSNHSTAPDFSGPFTPPGGNLNVGDATTVGVSFTHYFDDHWAAAFLFGIPPRIDTDGRGTLAPLGKISTVTANAPAFLAEYFFLPPKSAYQPYVGLGVNYTNFSDTSASQSLENSLGGPTSIKLQNSAGIAGQIGVKVPISDSWLLDFNLVAADVRSRESATTGFITRTTTIDFNPIVYTVSIGYRF
jgi:outer membrane protein